MRGAGWIGLLLLTVVGLASGTRQARAEGGERVRGTAFVVSPSGYLLTSLHVVKNAARIDASIAGTGYQATLVGSDEARDIALLRVRAENLAALPLADSNTVEVGLEVRVFGFPLTSALGTSLKATRGSVSGIEVEDRRQVFQVDATINPGNSGGPLVNEKGEAVGVVIARLTDAGAGNVGFVVPINEAKALLRAQTAAFDTTGAGEKLEGTALVKRVAPSVALLTVTPGSDLPVTPAPVPVVSPGPKPVQVPGGDPVPVRPIRPPGTPPEPAAEPLGGSPELSRTLSGGKEPILSVAVAADGKSLLAASSKGAHWFPVDAGTALRSLGAAKHSPAVSLAAVSSDGITAVAGADAAVRLWGATSTEPLRILPGEKAVRALAFSPDGKLLAVGGADTALHLWNTGTGELQRTMAAGETASLAFSPDGALLASGGTDGTVRLWETGTGTQRAALPGHTGAVAAVTWAPGGGVLVSAGTDGSLRWWDPALPTAKRVVATGAALSTAAFSPTGTLLATAGADHAVTLRDALTGDVVRILTGHTDAVSAVAFLPEGTGLASGSLDRSVRIWDLTGLKHACMDVTRELERIRESSPTALPRPQAEESGTAGETFSWNIINDTGGSLTVLFDGPEKRAVVIDARKSQIVMLRAGSYEVAARIQKVNVLPLYGRFDLAGGGRYRWRLFLAGR